MKLTKENVCVFIKDEAQLEQARELLYKYGCGIDESIDLFKMLKRNGWLYLQLYDSPKEWFFSKRNNKYLITLTELEQILKDGKEN